MSIIIHPPDLNSNLPLPNVGNQIVAGFPSPAEDYVEAMLDSNQLLLKIPALPFTAE